MTTPLVLGPSLLDPRIYASALAEMAEKSKKAIYQRDFPAWQYDVLGERTYEKMERIGEDVLFGKKNRTLIKSANGTSKDLALDTPILTTKGWSTMGDLREGDYVFDEKGLPTRVIVKSEIMHNPCYRITFDDGSSFIAGEGHLWNTISRADRSRACKSPGGVKDWRDHWDRSTTLKTHQIADTVGGRTKNHLVPLASPLVYAERDDLPIDPYVLGAWIGDGTTIRAEITCNYAVDGYVIDRIQASGYEMYHRIKDPLRPYSYMAVSDARLNGNLTSRFKLDLRKSGVLGNKHIPEAYFSASIEQRIELLRGLMDTDGWADVRGRQAGFGQSDEGIIRQFEELLSGLGVRFSTTSAMPKVGNRAWTVKFRPWFDPFTPGERKSKVFTSGSDKQASRSTGRTIVSVEPTLTVPTACISVEGESMLYLAGRTLVPTHNTYQAARWAMWWVTAFPPEESLAIITAPTLRQVEQGVFHYMKTSFGKVKGNAALANVPMPWPGWISEKGLWNYRTEGGNIALALAAVPSPSDAVSTFQGIRREGGRSLIELDEAGGVSKEIFTAIEALITSGGARMVGIGNPDRKATPFHHSFTNPDMAKEYNLHTISAYDLPSMTGEIVYPDNPEKQANMMKGLTGSDWICHKERVWQKGGEIYFDDALQQERRAGGTPNGVFLAKVLGEFPGDADNTFFPEDYISRAMHETEIEPDVDTPIVMGVDVAVEGDDESVVYVNRGGQIRLFGDTVTYMDGSEQRTTTGIWSKEDGVTAARRIHAIAMHLGANVIHIDGGGVGAPIASFLLRSAEFANRTYEVLVIKGANSSSDIRRWRNFRDEMHEYFSDRMRDGDIDLAPDDDTLKDELMLITYDLVSNAIKITPKRKMRTMLGGSPDRADAAMYAGIDSAKIIERGQPAPDGTIIVEEARQSTRFERYGDGYPV